MCLAPLPIPRRRFRSAIGSHLWGYRYNRGNARSPGAVTLPCDGNPQKSVCQAGTACRRSTAKEKHRGMPSYGRATPGLPGCPIVVVVVFDPMAAIQRQKETIGDAVMWARQRRVFPAVRSSSSSSSSSFSIRVWPLNGERKP
jgi:hypothetical protein